MAMLLGVPPKLLGALLPAPNGAPREKGRRKGRKGRKERRAFGLSLANQF